MYFELLFLFDSRAHRAVKDIVSAIVSAFIKLSWQEEIEILLRTGKADHSDLARNTIGLEREYSRLKMFFHGFFRFILLHHQRESDVGVIITYYDIAFKNGETGVYGQVDVCT